MMLSQVITKFHQQQAFARSLSHKSFVRHVRTAAVSRESNRRQDGNPARPPYRVLLFGSDYVTQTTLKRLIRNLRGYDQTRIVDHVEVVTPTPRTARSVQVSKLRQFALGNHIFVHESPDSLTGWSEFVEGMLASVPKFDIGVVVSFGTLLPEYVTRLFTSGEVINIHPSILPRHRGASPIPHTIMSGDSSAGVSIISLSWDKFDCGDIINQTSCPIDKGWTTDSLTKKLAMDGGDLLIDTLNDFDTLNRERFPQDPDNVTLAPKIAPGESVVQWDRLSVVEVDRLHRAIGAKAYLGNKLLSLDLFLLPDFFTSPFGGKDFCPGTVTYSRAMEALVIRCKDGWIGCKRVQPPTKKLQSAANFANGAGLRKGHKQLTSEAKI